MDSISTDVPVLVEALHDAGYRTGVLGKTLHGFPRRPGMFDELVRAPALAKGRDPEAYYRHAKEFIRKSRVEGKRFFLMANSLDPHRPFAGSDQETRKEKEKGAFPGVRRTVSPAEVTVPGFLPDLPEVKKEIAEYYSSVHRADEVVGAVLRALEEEAASGDTLVVFLSDHGMALPFAKNNCWYHSTRTPMIVRWPGVVPGGSVDRKHVVSGIDLAPTLLEAAGLPSLEGSDGRSMLPLFRGQHQEGRDFVFTQINTSGFHGFFPMRCVTGRRYGYVWNAWADGDTRFGSESQSGRTFDAMQAAAEKDPEIAERLRHYLYRTKEEFYDYEEDPDALRNLIDEQKHRETIRSFRRLLLNHMKGTGDPRSDAYEKFLMSLGGPGVEGSG